MSYARVLSVSFAQQILQCARLYDGSPLLSAGYSKLYDRNRKLRVHRIGPGDALAPLHTGRWYTGSQTFSIQNHKLLGTVIQRKPGHWRVPKTAINNDLSATSVLLYLSDLFAVYSDRTHLDARLLDKQRR